MAITTCFSFKRGFCQLPDEVKDEVKESIAAALRINSRMAWYNRFNGLVEPRMSEAKKIEDIFSNYNITDIWGE